LKPIVPAITQPSITPPVTVVCMKDIQKKLDSISIIENKIIHKLDSISFYMNEIIDKPEIFSIPEYDEMLNFLKKLKITNLSDFQFGSDMLNYTEFLLDLCHKNKKIQHYHQLYERYLKLQNIKKQSIMNET